MIEYGSSITKGLYERHGSVLFTTGRGPENIHVSMPRGHYPY